MKKDSSLARLTPDATLSQVINADQQAAELLSSIGLNPHDHKHQTLRSVCQKRQWNEVEVLQWIKKKCRSNIGKSDEEQQENTDFGTDLSKWCELLKDEYHASNLQLLEEISSSLPRVNQIHGNQYTWLKTMQWHFEQFEEALRMYYEFETRKFFPLLDRWLRSKGDLLDGTVRRLDRCLGIIERDQKRLKRFMKTLSEKSNNFENPEIACSTFRILNQNMKTLFKELERQLKIERESLLPVVREKVKAVYP